jgi:transcriptional regulator with XRE-family HTH domain
MKPTRTQGSVLLARTGKTAEEIGERCSVSRSLGSHWLNGQRKPTPAKRKLLKKHFEIPTTAWDRKPIAEKANGAPAPVEPVVAITLEQMHAAHMRTLTAQLAEANDPKTPAAERARLSQKIGSELERLTKRQRSELSEANIIKAPAWGRIWDKLIKAIDDAAILRKVAKALEELSQ